MDFWLGIVESISVPFVYLALTIVVFIGVVKPLFRYLTLRKQVQIETKIKKEFREKREMAKQDRLERRRAMENQHQAMDDAEKAEKNGEKTSPPATEAAGEAVKQSGLDAVEQQVKQWVRQD